MKRGLGIVLVSLAAGCGSGKSGGPLFGGFTPTSGAAVILAPATCTNIFPLPATGVSGILVELTGGADACNVLTRAQQCGVGSGSTEVLGVAVLGAVGGIVGPAGPGTYPWLANPPSGAFLATDGWAVQADACSFLGTNMTGGSIVISTVTGTSVAGSMDVGFENGQVFQQAFDVSICPVSIDICSLFDPCFPPVCVP
jgi:hypothetical protein